MHNVQMKFAKFEELQNKYSAKLDSLEKEEQKILYQGLGQSQLGYNSQSNDNNLDKEYEMYQEKEKLSNDVDDMLKRLEDRTITTNYLNFYTFLLKGPPKIQQQIIKEDINLKDKETVIEREIQVDSIKRSNSNIIKPQIVLSMNPGISSPIDWKEDNKAKNLLAKKQNIFLSNELTNLKVKIGKLNNKNKMLSAVIKSQTQVQNCKVLDKFIESFIEKLAINWNDIVEMIISELIEDEVLELNEIELKKIDYEKLRITTFEDIMRKCPSKKQGSHLNFNMMFESMNEVNDIITKAKKTERSIAEKYNIKA